MTPNVDWTVLWYLIVAGVVSSVAVLAGFNSDWQTAGEYGLLALCLLTLASKTAHVHMLEKALHNTVHHAGESDQ